MRSLLTHRTRRWIVTSSLVLAMAVIVSAAITAGNTISKGSADTHNVAATSGISTTGASLLVMGLSSYEPATTQPVIADSPGGGGANTWTGLTAISGAVQRIRLFYSVNPTVNASHTFSTTTGDTAFPSISVQAFAGTATSSPFDVERGVSGGSTSVSTGSIAPSADGEVLVACLSGAATADTVTVFEAGWSTPVGVSFLTGDHFGVWCVYKIQTTATAEGVTFQWQTSGEGDATIAAFKVFSGGGGATPCRRSLLGVGCDHLAIAQTTTPSMFPLLHRQELHSAR